MSGDAGRAAAAGPLVLLVGPTGVGKTELAVRVAPALGAEIVGADSRQIYRGMDVGTAKPTAAEQAAVRHHLIDLVEPDEGMDAATFVSLAHEAIARVRARGHLPLVVGGSGFYVRCLTDGLPEVPAVPAEVRHEIRRRVEVGGAPALHAELARVDPTSAARVHPNDAVRISRALEVHAATGRPLSAYLALAPYSGSVLRVYLDRPAPEMDARVAARVDAMWDAGLVAEVERLASRGYGAGTKAFDAVGYRETIAHLEGRCDAAEARGRIVVRTRRRVRKQRAWFRPSPGRASLHPEHDADRIRREIDALVRASAQGLVA